MTCLSTCDCSTVSVTCRAIRVHPFLERGLTTRCDNAEITAIRTMASVLVISVVEGLSLSAGLNKDEMN